MSAAAHLAGMGLVLKLEAGGRGLSIEGLRQLSLEDRSRALSMARKSKLSILAELERRGGVFSNSFVLHFRATCPDYWRGCLACPDANLLKPKRHPEERTSLNSQFCKRHPMPED